MANTRWPTSVGSSWATRPGSRPSEKQAAKRSTSPIARSVAPSSSAPASEVIAPPPKSATKSRRSSRANSIGSALHSVCIGVAPARGQAFVAEALSHDQAPDAPILREKSGLGLRDRRQRGGGAALGHQRRG